MDDDKMDDAEKVERIKHIMSNLIDSHHRFRRHKAGYFVKFGIAMGEALDEINEVLWWKEKRP